MKIIVVGAGINGVTASLELTRRGHKVALIDPGPLPHPLAASTDISKAVRAAYGTDEDYAELMERSIPRWRQWNDEFGEFFHETGFLCMRTRPLREGDYEFESLTTLKHRSQRVARVTSAQLKERFPAWNADFYVDGFFEHEAGYVESGRVVSVLIEQAKRAGVELREGCRFVQLAEKTGHVYGVILDEVEESRGRTVPVAQWDPSTVLRMTRISADCVVMTTGAWTPYLLPFTQKFFRTTGQPVFHLQPDNPELFAPERFPVFGADVSTTGYYGFPLNRDGVVKIANHGIGREMSPDSAERVVTKEDEKNLREFLKATFPALANAPIVYTRICLYCDTHDGHFWIARDPERDGLVVGAGDNGHGFKFAPILGELIADAVEEKPNRFLEKFRWRPEIRTGAAKESARRL